jgi:hypothetical protein
VKSRPLVFSFITFLLLGSIISVPLQIVYFSGATKVNLSILVNQISLFNWIVIFMSLITAIYSYFADSKVVISAIVLTASIFLNNYFVFSYAENIHWTLPILSSLFALSMLVSIFSNQNFRHAVFNQDKRWWLIPKRHRKTLPIWIQINDDKCLLARTYDVSKSGAFVSSISGIQNFIEKGLKVGSKVRVLIGDRENIEFQCHASVIRKSQAKGDYPSGIGLHFDKVTLKDKFALSRIMSSESFV